MTRRHVGVALILLGFVAIAFAFGVGTTSVTVERGGGIDCGSYFSADDPSVMRAARDSADRINEASGVEVGDPYLTTFDVLPSYQADCDDARDDRALPFWLLLVAGGLVVVGGVALAAIRSGAGPGAMPPTAFNGPTPPNPLTQPPSGH